MNKFLTVALSFAMAGTAMAETSFLRMGNGGGYGDSFKKQEVR